MHFAHCVKYYERRINFVMWNRIDEAEALLDRFHYYKAVSK